MEDPSLVEQWYDALFREDCVGIMKLLKKDPSLLLLGAKWEQVTGRPQNPWKGRTVFHVAARRGCVELVARALRLCNFEAMFLAHENVSCTELIDRVLALHNFEVLVANHDETLKQLKARASLPRISPGEVTTRGQGQSPQIDSERATEKDKDSVGSSQHALDDGRQAVGEIASAQEPGSAGEGSTGGNKAKEGGKERRAVPSTSLQLAPSVKSGNNDEGDVHEEPRHYLSDFPSIATDGEYVVRKIYEAREDLSDLLTSKDGDYELDALAMAALCGNTDLINLLAFAIYKCVSPTSDYKYCIDQSMDNYSITTLVGDDTADCREKRNLLRSATEELISCYNPTEISLCLEAYCRHLDFNFLPLEEYLFHFLCTFHLKYYFIVVALWSKFTSIPENFWQFVLNFQDGQGRPPVHVTVDEETVEEFLRTISVCVNTSNIDSNGSVDEEWADDYFEKKIASKEIDAEKFFFALNVLDAAGRTPVYRSAATGKSTKILYKEIPYITSDPYGSDYDQFLATFFESWEHSGGKGLVQLDGLSYLNGFRRGPHASTPIHAAVIHNDVEWVQQLKRTQNEVDWFPLPDYDYARSLSLHSGHSGLLIDTIDKIEREEAPEQIPLTALDDIELACLKNQWNVTEYLLRDLVEKGSRTSRRVLQDERTPHALHIVAASGSYQMLELFLNNPDCDISAEDSKGNTPLHYGMREPIEFESHLLDYINCKHLHHGKASGKVVKRCFIFDDNLLVNKQGCVELLLRAGCDVFKVNRAGEVPYPQDSLLQNLRFQSWWHQKQGKEFEVIQNNLTTAANAIIVTATLVATASYVGPLQPPLGLNNNEIQYSNVWVATFAFCNSLSFYLAITAIIFSLIPCLPTPQQGISESIDQLRQSRTMVTAAVVFLAPSIMCVFLAFASSSMSVISSNITSSIGGILTVTTFPVGGSCVLVALLFFLIRLMRILFYRFSWIRFTWIKWTRTWARWTRWAWMRFQLARVFCTRFVYKVISVKEAMQNYFHCLREYLSE